MCMCFSFILYINYNKKFLKNQYRKNAQDFGKNFVQNFFKISLDKISKVWYNGRFGSQAVACDPPSVRVNAKK